MAYGIVNSLQDILVKLTKNEQAAANHVFQLPILWYAKKVRTKGAGSIPAKSQKGVAVDFFYGMMMQQDGR